MIFYFIFRIVIMAIVYTFAKSKDYKNPWLYPLLSFISLPLAIIVLAIVGAKSKKVKNYSAHISSEDFEGVEVETPKESNYHDANQITAADFGGDAYASTDESFEEESYEEENYSEDYNEISSSDFDSYTHDSVQEGYEEGSYEEDKVEEVIEPPVAIVEELQPSHNLTIAEEYESIVKRKLGKNTLLDEFYEKSEVSILTKGRYESGKERDILSQLLLSRKDFLDKIEEKYRNFDQDKLKREFEIFNEFDAELEFKRRKEIEKL